MSSRPGEFSIQIMAGSRLWENEPKEMNLTEYLLCLNILRKELDNWRAHKDKLVIHIKKETRIK